MKKFKRAIIMTVCLLLTLTCFTGCLVTREFRRYSLFYEIYWVGMDKQAVLNWLDYPDGYRDTDGNYFQKSYRDNNEEVINKNALEDYAMMWYYYCYELTDPANPYVLFVHFNSDGEITNVEFNMIKGG